MDIAICSWRRIAGETSPARAARTNFKGGQRAVAGQYLSRQWAANLDMALSASSFASRWRSKMNLDALADRPTISPGPQRIRVNVEHERVSLVGHDHNMGWPASCR
jgi:hypothetical protein